MSEAHVRRLDSGVNVVAFEFSIVGVFVLGRLGQLFLPEAVCVRCVDVWEDKIEHFAVPGYRTAFDACFDVLR